MKDSSAALGPRPGLAPIKSDYFASISQRPLWRKSEIDWPQRVKFLRIECIFFFIFFFHGNGHSAIIFQTDNGKLCSPWTFSLLSFLPSSEGLRKVVFQEVKREIDIFSKMCISTVQKISTECV
jgi:hypothetical protein